MKRAGCLLLFSSIIHFQLAGAIIARYMGEKWSITGAELSATTENGYTECYVRAVGLNASSFKFNTQSKACTPIGKVYGPWPNSDKNLRTYFLYKEKKDNLCEGDVVADVREANAQHAGGSWLG
ncbi:hypothetical protein QR680_011786 [Steinernema hermaphroditum]|uniref:C-type lectin domain-containing protein n=1 Tax=Steinernema hermaphroditum TaxID=289476 RepID=A0AA39LZL3_9BILA|nr:hypothetical protein QR680_011786 [Steinernema hermaphroditum]